MDESKSSVLWPAEVRKKREGWGWLFGASPVGLYWTLRLVHKITRVNLLLYLKFCIIWSRNRTKRPILGPNIGQSVKVLCNFFFEKSWFFPWESRNYARENWAEVSSKKQILSARATEFCCKRSGNSLVYTNQCGGRISKNVIFFCNQ